MGFGSFLNKSILVNGGDADDLRPQDLFSWPSTASRNLCINGSRYFSINGGSTHLVDFDHGVGQFGIPDAMANPRLELHNGTGALIASNDDWQTTIIGGLITSNQVSDVQNSGHAPTSVSESAIIADLQPDNCTAIVSGVNNTPGVALVEVYDLN